MLCLDRLDNGRRCAALVEDVQRLVDDPGAQETEPRVDREHVEAVVRDSSRGDGVVDVFPGAADAPAEAIIDVCASSLGPTRSSSSLPTQ